MDVDIVWSRASTCAATHVHGHGRARFHFKNGIRVGTLNTQEELPPVMDCDEEIPETSLAVQFFSSSFGSTGSRLQQSRVDVRSCLSSQVNLTASQADASRFPRLRLDIVNFEEPSLGQRLKSRCSFSKRRDRLIFSFLNRGWRRRSRTSLQLFALFDFFSSLRRERRFWSAHPTGELQSGFGREKCLVTGFAFRKG